MLLLLGDKEGAHAARLPLGGKEKGVSLNCWRWHGVRVRWCACSSFFPCQGRMHSLEQHALRKQSGA